jgi:hypothetical protein
MCTGSDVLSKAVLMVEGLIVHLGIEGTSVQFLGCLLNKARQPTSEILGDRGGEDTPGHIPNPVVKLSSADGTSLVTGWESRSLPRISLLDSQPHRPHTPAWPGDSFSLTPTPATSVDRHAPLA